MGSLGLTGILFTSLGLADILFIAVIILLLFGGSRLPGVARGVGSGIRNFKRSLRDPEQQQLEDKRDTPKR
ncbi:MAG: twin-arginine translocase TatA/TatE family subunit [Acidobacteriota bacterium]|nr:twin-arginine translocase TatA/TatE family subunit [Acidobacteriota bacterium]